MDEAGPSTAVGFPIKRPGGEDAYDDIVEDAFHSVITLINKGYTCWRKTGAGPDGYISHKDRTLEPGFRKVVRDILREAMALDPETLNRIVEEEFYDEGIEEDQESPSEAGTAMEQDITMDDSFPPATRHPPAPKSTPTGQSPAALYSNNPSIPVSSDTPAPALVGIPSFITQLEESRIGAAEQATICANMIALLQSVGPVVDEASARTEEIMLHGCQNAIRFELMPKASECIKRSVRMLRARGKSAEDVQLNALEAGLGALNL